MKKAKTNLILNLVLLTAAIFIVLVIFRNAEGFQAETVVTLNYGIDSNSKLVLISSSNPGVTDAGGAVGVAKVNVAASLGRLKRYNGFGWSTNKWLPLAAAKLDRGSGSLFLTSPDQKTIHNPNYSLSIPQGSQTEVKLTTAGLAVPTLTMNNLLTSVFPVVGSGDPAIQNAAGLKAKIRVVLNF